MEGPIGKSEMLGVGFEAGDLRSQTPSCNLLQPLDQHGVVQVGGNDTTGVYEYLPASIRNFPDQERLKQVLLDAGFRQVTYRNLTGGIVAIHVAVK